MSGFPCPHCGEVVDVFGSGGGASVSESLSRLTGTTVPLLGKVPLDVRLREGGDAGLPLVLSDKTAPAAAALREIASTIGGKPRGLAGRSLSISPVRSA
jgi:ATP-binding protein involved in chromosome partitioning